MLIKKLVLLGTISTLLVTTVLGADTKKCAGGVCFINLDNLQPSKAFVKKKDKLLVLEKPRYIVSATKNNNIDKLRTIILDGERMTVFPKSTYVMTEEEKINYFENEAANKDLLMLTKTVEKIEDKILEKSNLPSSEYYCEKKTKPIYNKALDSFQCV